MTGADTLPKLLLKNYREYNKKIALLHKDRGIWQHYSWNDYYNKVKYFSLGLLILGMKKGDSISIIGDNEPEWYWSELAAMAIGGVAVGIYTDSIPEEIKYIVSHSESKFVVASDQEQVDKMIQIKNDLPLLQKVIYWDFKGLSHYEDPILISWDEIVDKGRAYEVEHTGIFEELVERGKGSDFALNMYTSGTTGLPKGVIRTHDSLVSAAEAWVKELEVTEKDRRFSFYPPAWILEQHEGVSVSIFSGQVVGFPESPNTAFHDLRQIGPTIFFVGPRIWEDLASQIFMRIEESTTLKKFIYHLSLPIGTKVAERRMEKKSLGSVLTIFYWLAELVVFRPLRDKIGLRHVREGFTAGAMLSPEAFRFFRSMGIPIKQCYGLTEMAPITMHRRGEVHPETSGKPIEGAEIKISEEGEVLVKGPSMCSGYYKNDEETLKTFRDGWLHTSDGGYITDDGELVILDRLKDFVELKNGVKYAPQFIESRLKFSPYIKDAVALGGLDRDFVAVLINIKFENVSKWAERQNISYTTFADLSQKPEVFSLIAKEINRVNKFLPPETRIKRFANLYKELDPDEAELTRTRKVRRSFFEDRYKFLVSGLYSVAPSLELETEVKYRDGKIGHLKTKVHFMSIGGE